MYFKLSDSQENYMLSLAETGMGYQVIEARRSGNYKSEKFLVLNSEIVVEMDASLDDNVRRVTNEGTINTKLRASLITLNAIRIVNEIEYRNVSESKKENENGATANAVEYSDGKELFVRLSAFDNDKRVDKENKCLRPGSFTTTEDDYIKCKYLNLDPVERYALPNNDKIKYAFHIQPQSFDTLQRGTVQPANGKPGGGEEVYFANGTAPGTFLKQTPY
jgi:hypothetical protein